MKNQKTVHLAMICATIILIAFKGCTMSVKVPPKVEFSHKMNLDTKVSMDTLSGKNHMILEHRNR